jgi:glycosyltransferase involved in cell wall biosynthesis
VKNIKVLLMTAAFLLLGNGNMFSDDPIKDQVLEKPMVIIIPSYNNKNWYQNNLTSVLGQDYSNYRVMYIDDCSTDGMSELVQEFIKQNDINHCVTYIRNKENHGCLYNVYYAIMSCDDNVIIVKVDGDDWLPHNQVLRKINEVYQDNNVWLTHGSLVLYPMGGNSEFHAYDSEIIKNCRYRSVQWEASHLHTFYAWLFKNIIKEDLMYDETFFSTTEDLARMFPMLEMADGRIAFIKDVLYVYNMANMISDFRIKSDLQGKCELEIRSRKRYARLEHAGIRDVKAPIYRS